jgi:hypothetical protein
MLKRISGVIVSVLVSSVVEHGFEHRLGQRLQEEFEHTKGAIRIRISKKNRQHNGQKKKVQNDKQRSTKHSYKSKDRVT